MCRTDPILIDIVRELGEKANGKHAELAIRYIPGCMEKYNRIHQYDGTESIELLETDYKMDIIKRINNDDDLEPNEKKSLINQVIEMKIPGPQKDCFCKIN